ncbi:sensor histidine kinase [Sporosarcina highlanderae]|uniref:histidine kinase n=1 Tax=Sporosarcina highlanderae TaxID=3035916 RepID=A0ABT8JU66_9BACL|nr:sensor histidine kinase [Sporosarcina highlanderae]MDN4608437.1 sensor histidine kinase [Sporosarcina highlanderae]
MSASFNQYIRFQKRLIILYAGIMSFVTIMLYVEPSMSIHFSNILYIHVISLFFLITYLAIDYYIIAKHHKEISSRYSNGLFIQDGIGAAQTYEQQLYVELLQSVNDAHQQQLTSIIRDKKESMEFMTTWFHDIKTPIAISKLIMEQAKGSPENESIQEEISRIERSVNQALYFTRTDHFARDYFISRAKLDIIVKSVVKKFAKEFIKRKIKVDLHIQTVVIETDIKWLVYSLSEFVSNALKYSEDGGTITFITEDDTNEVRLKIKDHGIGIPEHDIGRVFELGFTGTNGRVNNKSTGIGLYIAKKIIDKIGHRVTISSTINMYTVITVHFPKGDDYYAIVQ